MLADYFETSCCCVHHLHHRCGRKHLLRGVHAGRPIHRRDEGGTTRIHRSRDRCRHMPPPEPEASTPTTSSASDGRLAPGPPTSSVVIAAGPVDGRHLVRGVLLQAARHLPRGLQDNLRSDLQAYLLPAGKMSLQVFWTASRRQMSRASRSAHSQCSAIRSELSF